MASSFSKGSFVSKKRPIFDENCTVQLVNSDNEHQITSSGVGNGHNQKEPNTDLWTKKHIPFNLVSFFIFYQSYLFSLSRTPTASKRKNVRNSFACAPKTTG